MTETTETVETPPEFPTEEHRDAHIVALIREKEGYQAKVAGHDVRGEKDKSAYYATRVGEVDAELNRLGAAAKTARARAETR
jgi:alpha-D-ribose 1-methylphosphonate 5-triphosphate synthase subunit PhnI